MPDTYRLQFTSRDFDTAVADFHAYVAATEPTLQTDFQETALGTVLIDVCGLVVDQTSFGADAAGLEVFLDTCNRYESAIRFARSVGYTPRGATGATVTMTAVSFPSASFAADWGTIPAGSSIVANGTEYTLLADVVLAVGTTASTVSLTEGAQKEETYDPSRQPWLRLVTEEYVVGDGSWEAWVGDTAVSGNQWTEVDSLALEDGATETFEVIYDGLGRAEFIFGNGVTGKIPDDTITIRYRTSIGFDGNAPTDNISGVLSAEMNLGGTVEITYRNSTEAATGGLDRETLDELRVNVPAFLRSSDKLTTLTDYDTVPLQLSYVGLVHTDIWFAGNAGNAVKVNVWGTEDVTFTGESDADSNQTEVDYMRYVTMSTVNADALNVWLRDRTLTNLHNSVINEDVAWADIYLGDVQYDELYDIATVHAAITTAVVEMFQDADGFNLRMGDLYRVIQGVDGVVQVTVQRVVFERESRTRATGQVQFIRATAPSDGDTVTINDGESEVTFEFDDDSTSTEGNIAVEIGFSSENAAAALAAAINGNLELIYAVVDDTSDPSFVYTTLYQRRGGSYYNLTTTKVGVTLTVSGMSGGDEVIDYVREDYRQNPLVDGDWPPGTYEPGTPFTGTDPWQVGGILPYFPLEDITIPLDRFGERYYSEAGIYNNEIVYDSGRDDAVVPNSINLRRLLFNLVPYAP